MASLNPIDHTEDKEKYEAREFKTEVKFTPCTHKNTKLNDTRTELRCTCGKAWGGTRLGELKQMLDNR